MLFAVLRLLCTRASSQSSRNVMARERRFSGSLMPSIFWVWRFASSFSLPRCESRLSRGVLSPPRPSNESTRSRFPSLFRKFHAAAPCVEAIALDRNCKSQTHSIPECRGESTLSGRVESILSQGRVEPRYWTPARRPHSERNSLRIWYLI